MQEPDHPDRKRNDWARYQTTDPAAPVYYSRLVIFIFAALFSTLVGSLMLASNLKNGPGTSMRRQVLGFGFGFTAFILALAILLPANTSNALFTGLNAGAGWFLSTYLWNKSIGETTEYRARSFALPLTICLVVSSLLLGLIILGAQAESSGIE